MCTGEMEYGGGSRGGDKFPCHPVKFHHFERIAVNGRLEPFVTIKHHSLYPDRDRQTDANRKVFATVFNTL